jgi:ferritin
VNNNLLIALQNQLTLERTNAAAYDVLSTSLDAVNWQGASEWMKQAANEEREHAQKFADYIIARNAIPQSQSLPVITPPAGDDLVLYFQAAMAREQVTTEAINTLHYQAEDEEDPATCQFLLWFIAEQVKSEREITDILTSLARLDNNGRQVFDGTLAND